MNEKTCPAHGVPIVDGRCMKDVELGEILDQARDARIARAKLLREERETIERNMYAEVQRLTEIRYQLDRLDGFGLERLDG